LNKYLEQLEETEANLVVFKDDKVIFTSDRRGVSPLIEVIEQIGLDELKNVVTADRIVGKAAVLLNAYMGSKAVYAMVMSTAAVETADKFGFEYSHRELVDYIINRDGTGMCPFEQLVKDMKDPHNAFHKIKEKIVEMTTN